MNNSSTIRECRFFYDNYGRSMIHDKFPQYESRIAVGLVGEGSECFGFDDEISRDHDFGLGFCMWLTDDDYNAIGAQLQREYEALGANLQGRLMARRGVMRINDFYLRTTGIDFSRSELAGNTMPDQYWMAVNPENLATAVNGEVFRDDLGSFTRIRNLINGYYPEKIWLMRLVNALHDYSQYGQANYPRCMARRDFVTAAMCRGKALEAAMEIAFLLAKSYGPYYKWKFKTLEQVEAKCGLYGLAQLLVKAAQLPDQSAAWNGFAYDATRINPADAFVQIADEIGEIIAQPLVRRGLTDKPERFLEYHCQVIAAKINGGF